MTDVSFLLNGEAVTVSSPPATQTLLDWLRIERGLIGTKEGCNEGDCGACTLMVSTLENDQIIHRAQNACILFLPQLSGKSVRTVEGLKSPDGDLHPVQSEMVKHHGSQCGFCTPGFIMSMATAHRNGDTAHDDVLAGNLCRCTGYAPIIKAAEAASQTEIPAWLADEKTQLEALQKDRNTLEDFVNWYEANPDATLISGATDVGLWVTKQHRHLDNICFIGQIEELREISITDDHIRLGACVTINELREAVEPHHPDLAEMLRRYGSTQVRNAATIGGNIANGSPIGDAPPALIALNATLHLRKGRAIRQMPLEDFFIAYGKQDREAGEFVEAITIPRQTDNLKCYKISKRFDQDISALLGCFSITIEDGKVTNARIAFGGMAATPKRATHVEAALTGRPWTEDTIRAATQAFAKDFAPMSDARASAEYRMKTAENLLTRYFAESQIGTSYTRVLEVKA